MERAAPERPGPRFLIADDHAIFAETFKSFLQSHYSVVGVVGDGKTLIDEVSRLRPDIVIVDIGMPVLNGLEAARRLHHTFPKMKFVFLTMYDDPNLAAAAVQEFGPVGFVLKHSGGVEVLKAIESVLRGCSYVTAKLKSEDWVEAGARARQFSRALTPRQRDVLQLYAEGHSMKQIAGLLSVSQKTIEFHKHHIMESYSLSSNADLVLFALKQGLIFIEPATSAGKIL
ncbi:response regulator transcription factor [Edaphobacter sp. HDX4]|uniref:response regulator transcription factor n=1 Tax=Edaphobacter sp. HDX4 TaxID=2794064 RepID=UPI002FE569D8